jgi:hypothetical protein
MTIEKTDKRLNGLGSEIVYTDISDVPSRQRDVADGWKRRFAAIPDGKAAMLRYNNRQRAHQVVTRIRSAAKVHRIAVGTRVIHGVVEIDGHNDWIVYYWIKRMEQANKEKGGEKSLV